LTFLHTGRALLCGTALSIAAFVPAAQARHYQVLHSFDGSDGSFPNGNLQLDSAGNLYGTTPDGGGSGHGAIFKLSSTGDFSLAYSFTGGSDGGEPLAGLTVDPATGDLYGTTASGGANGLGGIFKLTSAGELAVLHDFKSRSDGDQPSGALTSDGQGNFYGTTYQDGEHGNGTVFELAANGGFQVLHALAAIDGGEPIGRLTLHGTALYGTTTVGGSGSGTIFELDLDGTFTTLQTPNTGGGLQGGMVRDKRGNLYGGYSTGDGGYIFVLSPQGTMSPLYSFTGGADGRFPVGDMLLTSRHELFGATARGGANGDNGTVYKLDLKGNFTLLHGFAGAPRDGTEPSGGLVKGPGGKLYGTTLRGGRNDMGIIFAVSAK
jgi:uncharacterized repeat protein (TIGR03803 family)